MIISDTKRLVVRDVQVGDTVYVLGRGWMAVVGCETDARRTTLRFGVEENAQVHFAWNQMISVVRRKSAQIDA